MKTEKNYEFKKRLLCVHKENIRDYKLKVELNEIEIKDGCKIVLPENAGAVALTAAKDFVDYLFTSMNVSAMLSKKDSGSNTVCLCIDEKTEDLYRILVDETITVYSKTERGLAQGLYYLEDIMSTRYAPFVKKGEIIGECLFSPRMVHSGYGIDEYPNEHLAAIAHAGMDSIIVFCKDINKNLKNEFQDFNELIYRASNYGLDVYAFAYFRSDKHPEDEGAQEYFDSIYGSLFEKCPGFKGVILVGEAAEFRTKDPKASQKFCYENTEDGIPTGKPSAGWWPCVDYPMWLECVKKSVRKHREDADIIFWTYNWGYAPEEDRIKLINSLPTDISLLVTFEMFEKYSVGESIGTVGDYTLSFSGPGGYFLSEAKAAKKRGIRLYAMANTAGQTWDLGVVPYEPMPYAWIKRYKALIDAKEKWSLCGIMESHHYGLWPSFISDLTKQAFTKTDDRTIEQKLLDILAKWFGYENVESVNEALKSWSEAIACFTPSIEEQCGAFRIGTSLPFSLITPIKPPSYDYAVFGNGIVDGMYPDVYLGREDLPMLRIEDEIVSLEKMYSHMETGIKALEKIEQKNAELCYLLNMGRFIACITKTGVNIKKWYYTKTRLKAEQDTNRITEYIKTLRSIAEEERKNALSSIEYVKYDSRLGWEPSLEYMCDEEHIRWKLRHLEYVLNYELPNFEKGLRKSI